MEREQKTTSQNHSSASTFVMGIVAVFAIGLVGLGIYGYLGVKNFSQNGAAVGVANIFGISVATVNGEEISYSEYVRDMDIVRGFYEQEAAATGSEANYTDEEISDQVMSRLIANKIVGQVADEFNVEVTDEELDAAMQSLIAQAPDQATAEQEIRDRFGWSINEYKENVLYHIVREQQLQQAFEEQSANMAVGDKREEVQARHILFRVTEEDAKETVRAQAQEIYDQIANGEDFAALAAEYGSDGTAAAGGDLGWFGEGIMVSEFEDAAFSLEEPGLYPELVETDFGYHILEVTGKREVGDFQSFMDNRLRDAEIVIKADGIRNPFAEAQAAAKVNAQNDASSDEAMMEESQ